MQALYANWPINLLVGATTAVTVALAVLLHYEGLVWMSARLARHDSGRQHRKVLYGIYAVLALHVTEIWLFGLALWWLLGLGGTGHVTGMEDDMLLEAVYLSAATFTTVGFGDLAPVGAIRFLSGTEALTGLVLITWSASFTYFEMEKFWRNR
jgi:hypothetical protein